MSAYPSPCVGCRHASWYAHAEAYGRCVHPTVVASANAPMVLRSRQYAESIKREYMMDPPPVCPAREPTPEELTAPFTTHVAAAVDALNAERGT